MASVASVSAKTEPIKVLVTDNTPMGADLLARTLKRDRRFQVVGTISTPDEILESARRNHPDIAILTHQDNESPIRFRAARELRAALPNLKLVIILDSSERLLVVEAFRTGAKGILCRNMSVKSLSKCLECVRDGQIWATSSEMQYVLDALVESPPIRLADSKGAPLLTNQEQAVVHWMTEGLSNREIAAQLNLSEHTVKNYIFRIFDKLGVSKRVEVVLYALNQREITKNNGHSLDENSGQEDRLLYPWCRNQAEGGSAAAAFMLAQMYRDGRGIRRDLVEAYAWFVSAQHASEEFRELSRSACDQLSKTMNHEEIIAALSRVSDLHRTRQVQSGLQAKADPDEFLLGEIEAGGPENGGKDRVPRETPKTS